MELRRDYVLDRWVIISEKRDARPFEFKKEKATKAKNCAFCPGNENLTPPEIGRIGGNKWRMRWFENKFAAVLAEGEPKVKTKELFYTKASAYGKHEIIVETPTHRQLAELPVSSIAELLGVYSGRIEELSRIPEVKYVSVFKNSGANAGASLVHSHSQAIAYNWVPTMVHAEIEASKHYEDCPYCSIASTEMKSPRGIFENRYFAVFAPYASRFNYEAWIFPKRHIKSITEMDREMLMQMAEALKKILVKLKNISYNYFLHYAPNRQDLHFHIEVCPRISVWGGFEYCTNTIINSVPPEEAAKFYR